MAESPFTENKLPKLLLNTTASSQLSISQLNKVVLAGGVSANSYIRNKFEKMGKENNIEVYFPELKLCTDNAAMIASAGYYNFLKGTRGELDLNAIPNLKLEVHE